MGNEPSTNTYHEDAIHGSSNDDDNKPDGCRDEGSRHIDVPPSNDNDDSSPTTAKDMTSLNENDIETSNTSMCPCCDKPAKLLCTRCRAQRYCSKVCQKSHWINGHKQECKSKDGRIILVDLDPEFMQNILEKTPQSTSPASSSNSIDGSIMISTTGRPRATALSESNNFQSLLQLLCGKKFPLKIQAALQGPDDHPPMMCYNEKRNFRYFIHAGNCKKAHLLENTIRNSGLLDGAKLYCKAEIQIPPPSPQQPKQSTGGVRAKLAIYLDQQLGSLPW